MSDETNRESSSISKVIELTANTVTICVVVVGLAVLAIAQLWPSHEGRELAVGEKLKVGALEWSTHKYNIVLALQTGCHFCSESAPFYRTLLKGISNNQDVQVIAVLPDSADESHRYLKEEGIEPHVVVQSDLKSLGIRGTPTVVVADSNGKIAGVWEGKLSPQKEEQVFRQIGIDSIAAVPCIGCGGQPPAGK